MITRREALAGAGALTMLATTPALGQARPLVHVSIVPIFAVVAQFAAAKFGYFAAEGLDTTTIPVQGGQVGIPGLVAGSFDILYCNSISYLTALERGIDLRIVCSGAPIPRHPPDPGGFLMKTGAGLKSGRDLEGKFVGINALYDIQWLCASGWIRKNGGDPAKVHFREVPLPSMLDAIRGGQVATALVLDPFFMKGRSDPGFELLGWPLSTTMAGLSSSLWITSGSFADQKPDLLRAYARGFLRGAAWANAHLGDEQYRQLVSSYTHVDPALMAKMVMQPQPTSVDVPAITGLVSLMQDYKLLHTDVAPLIKVFKV